MQKDTGRKHFDTDPSTTNEVSMEPLFKGLDIGSKSAADALGLETALSVANVQSDKAMPESAKSTLEKTNACKRIYHKIMNVENNSNFGIVVDCVKKRALTLQQLLDI